MKSGRWSAAAVIGRSFSFQLLTGISQIDIDELFTVIEKAQLMGVVVPSSDGPERPYTFAHELVRQTLLAGISASRRQRLHAGVAEAMERLYPGAVNEFAGGFLTISSRQDRSLAAKQSSVGWRWPERALLRRRHLRSAGQFPVRPVASGRR